MNNLLETITLTKLMVLILPILVIQLTLTAYCLIKLFKEGVETLNKTAWILIILFVNLFGSIAFLIFGRKK